MSGVLTVADTPARTVLLELLRPLLPKRWVLVDDERPVPASSSTRVRFSQRTIAKGNVGNARVHLVTFRLTMTVETETIQAAEQLLDDDLDAFLFALDAANIPWEKADKGQYGDESNRLGYQVEITVYTYPSPKEAE